jgi:predicted nucleic acid-binding protein
VKPPDLALIDSAVPILAAGDPSELRSSCRRLIEMGASRRIRLLASTEMIQEFTFHRLRRTGDRQRSVTEAEELMAFIETVPFDNSILRDSLELIRKTSLIRGRDAVHAATALALGLEWVITPDNDFDGVPGLSRLDPAAIDFGESPAQAGH